MQKAYFHSKTFPCSKLFSDQNPKVEKYININKSQAYKLLRKKVSEFELNPKDLNHLTAGTREAIHFFTYNLNVFSQLL